MGIRSARGTLIKIGLRMGTLSRRVMECDWGGGLGVQLNGKGNGWMGGEVWGGGVQVIVLFLYDRCCECARCIIMAVLRVNVLFY